MVVLITAVGPLAGANCGLVMSFPPCCWGWELCWLWDGASWEGGSEEAGVWEDEPPPLPQAASISRASPAARIFWMVMDGSLQWS